MSCSGQDLVLKRSRFDQRTAKPSAPRPLARRRRLLLCGTRTYCRLPVWLQVRQCGTARRGNQADRPGGHVSGLSCYCTRMRPGPGPASSRSQPLPLQALRPVRCPHALPCLPGCAPMQRGGHWGDPAGDCDAEAVPVAQHHAILWLAGRLLLCWHLSAEHGRLGRQGGALTEQRRPCWAASRHAALRSL